MSAFKSNYIKHYGAISRGYKMKRAVILLSGGLDSATTLAVAKQEGYECYAISFDYGQRLRAELKAAKRLAEQLAVKEHRVFNLDISQFGGSALTDPSIDVPTQETDGIPVTYVPARNTIFLSIALSWAETIGAYDLFYGANIVDYSGYTDCRPEFIEAFERLALLGTKACVEDYEFKVHAPLLNLHKYEIIKRGLSLGLDYSQTVSCYNADSDGRACGQCDSCRFRAEGFEKLGVEDPTRYVAVPA